MPKNRGDQPFKLGCLKDPRLVGIMWHSLKHGHFNLANAVNMCYILRMRCGE